MPLRLHTRQWEEEDKGVNACDWGGGEFLLEWIAVVTQDKRIEASPVDRNSLRQQLHNKSSRAHDGTRAVSINARDNCHMKSK